MLSKKTLAGILFAMLATVKGASTGTGKEVQNGYNIQMWYNTATQKVNYEVVIPNNTYFALMIGS
jgi:hypothetical protein